MFCRNRKNNKIGENNDILDSKPKSKKSNESDFKWEYSYRVSDDCNDKHL